MLKERYSTNLIEAGCDEAGRGCLAGPVYAAAVVLPDGYHNELLNDSKKLTDRQRHQLSNREQKPYVHNIAQLREQPRHGNQDENLAED